MGESGRRTEPDVLGRRFCQASVVHLQLTRSTLKVTLLWDSALYTCPGLDGRQTKMKDPQGLSASSVEGGPLIICVPPGAGVEESF